MGRAHRALPFRRHDHQGMMRAEQGLGIEPVQVDGLLPRGRARQVPPPRRSSKASDWVKVTRADIADAKAIVPAGDAAGSGPSEPAEAAIHGEAADPTLPIRVLVGRVE